MKCNSCGSTWDVNPGLSLSINNCPFCGKALLPEKEKFDTAEDVLTEINRRFGVHILTDETKLIAYFSDLAPQLSKQRRILGYFIECGGPKKLAAVMHSSQKEQTSCVKRIVSEMKEEMFIEETASRMICDAFLFALSGHQATDGLAAEPSAEELFQQGENYYHGTSTVPRDYQHAFSCYQKAAASGHTMAQCQLGIMYRDGLGTAKSEKKALDWFAKAVQKGSASGLTSMLLLVDKKERLTEAKCKTLMQALGNIDAALEPVLGKSGYHAASEMTRYESTRAVGSKIMQLCARSGNADAQLWLGQAYDAGSLLAKNTNLAIHWYKKAAGQGNEAAAVLLRKLRRIDLSPARVAALVRKYRLGCVYLVSDSEDFKKKISKAASAYAPKALQETPVLMEDATIFGSAKEGFILTQKTLYYSGGFLIGKSSYPVNSIVSASVTLKNISHISLEIASDDPGTDNTELNITYSNRQDEAIRIKDFWNQLLTSSKK